jgi:hypothetical protein
MNMNWILLASVVAAGVQTPAPAPLSTAVREHLRADALAPMAHVAELPKLVQDALKANFSSPTQMADPGQEWQATDVVMNPNLPTRRLISAGCSSDHCLIHYEQGGFAHFYRVLLISVSKTAAKIEWTGMSGGPTTNVAEVQAQVVAGKIKS